MHKERVLVPEQWRPRRIADGQADIHPQHDPQQQLCRSSQRGSRCRPMLSIRRPQLSPPPCTSAAVAATIPWPGFVAGFAGNEGDIISGCWGICEFARHPRIRANRSLAPGPEARPAQGRRIQTVYTVEARLRAWHAKVMAHGCAAGNARSPPAKACSPATASPCYLCGIPVTMSLARLCELPSSLRPSFRKWTASSPRSARR